MADSEFNLEVKKAFMQKCKEFEQCLNEQIKQNRKQNQNHSQNVQLFRQFVNLTKEFYEESKFYLKHLVETEHENANVDTKLICGKCHKATISCEHCGIQDWYYNNSNNMCCINCDTCWFSCERCESYGSDS